MTACSRRSDRGTAPQERLDEAVRTVASRFPFEGYMDRAVDLHHLVARTAMSHIAPEGRILDFGAGACDKLAVLRFLGFECFACDDLGDYWHTLGDNRAKITSFCSDIGIDFHLQRDASLPYEHDYFDMIMLHDVLEHLHDSPRDLLNDLLERLKPEGHLFVTVPNAGNIRKRVSLLTGRTNLPSFSQYYWTPGPWRGHVREYVKGDLKELAAFTGLETVELRSFHNMIRKLPSMSRPIYRAVTLACPGWRDSWLFLGRKPRDWRPRRRLEREELARILESSTPYKYGEM